MQNKQKYRSKQSSKGLKDDRSLTRENKTPLHKRNSSKNIRRGKEIADTAIEMSRENDYAWYAKFPQFTKDAGTLAFGIPVGQQIVLSPSDNITIPGIMKICFLPGVGYAQTLADPINRMAMRFYTYLRDVQKAAAKYDAADIMMYLLAIDSLMAYHSLMRRAYGVAQLYTPVNKYYPKSLLQMMGFDPSIANNLAEFRAYINRFAIAIGSYCMPKDFDIAVRHKWMCEGVYLDSNTTRAQSYCFVPEGFWQFDNTVTTGSQLKLLRWQEAGQSHTLHNLSQVQAIGDSLLNAILGDQDTGNISGDLYAKYTPSGLMKIEETPEMYALMPVYNETVLSQIENATICGQIVGTPTITQNPSVNNGAIQYSPSFTFGSISIGDNLYVCPVRNYAPINMHKDSPTAEEVIEATRLSVCFKNPTFTEDTATFFPDVFGSDIVTRTWIAVYNADTPGALSSIYSETSYIKTNQGETTATLSTKLQYLALQSSFDWAPDLWLFQVGTGNAINVTQSAFDADNLTQASHTQLAMMHEAALLSMLDVPQMGM